MTNKGTCQKHGEFILVEGCKGCFTERRAGERFTTYEIKEKDNRDNWGDELLQSAAVPETAIALRAGEDLEARGYFEEAEKLLVYAESRVIATAEDDKLANDDLVIIGDLKKVMEAKRVELVKPMQDEVKAIQETHKALMAPVLEADRITRVKSTAFKMKQRRIAQEAEELNRQAMEVARKQAAMNNGEFTTDITPVDVKVAPKLTRTELGTSGLVDEWKYRIVDLEKLPREYMIPDDAMLKSIAKQHHDKKSVDGVEFYNDPHIAVRR